MGLAAPSLPSGCSKAQGAGWAWGVLSNSISVEKGPASSALLRGAGWWPVLTVSVPQLNGIQLPPRNLREVHGFLGQPALPTAGSSRPAASRMEVWEEPQAHRISVEQFRGKVGRMLLVWEARECRGGECAFKDLDGMEDGWWDCRAE